MCMGSDGGPAAGHLFYLDESIATLLERAHVSAPVSNKVVASQSYSRRMGGLESSASAESCSVSVPLPAGAATQLMRLWPPLPLCPWPLARPRLAGRQAAARWPAALALRWHEGSV